MSEIQAWFEAASTEQQLGIMVPVTALKAWYSSGEEPDTVDLAFRQQGIGQKEIVAGLTAYVHMTYGDYPSFPEAVRRFLADSPALIVPVLRLYVKGLVQELTEIPAGPLTTVLVNSIIGVLLFLELGPKASQVSGAAMMDEFIENRLQYSVIGEDVEAAVRTCLASGEYPQRHPAYKFLRSIVEVAPATRKLPERAKDLVAFLTDLA